MADARSDILDRLRAGRHQAPPVPPATAAMAPNDLVTLFVERAKAGRATVDILAGEGEIRAAVLRYLDAQALPHRLVCGLTFPVDLAGIECMDFDACDWANDGVIVLGGCLAGVAETGTIVVTSGQDHDTRINYLAETLLIVLPARDIVTAYEEIWPGLRDEKAAVPRLVSFVTGPSRTADIEQTIELGAHGPRRLHLLVLAESP